MNLQQRIRAFIKLGELLQNGISIEPIENAISKAQFVNPWFIPSFCKQALASVATDWLSEGALNTWVNRYPFFNNERSVPIRVAVVMAGNVPFVGFHDLLCVLIAGNTFVGKVSSKDGGLMQALTDVLVRIEPRFKNRIELTEGTLPDFDAVIATGNDNSSRYFEYYFGRYPNIIRRNRSSIAVITGNESEQEYIGLSHDIFSYFGLGCRNVSLLLLPKGFGLPVLLPHFEGYRYLAYNHRYANNYEYNRALFLMNKVSHFDNGFCTFVENAVVGSPVGVTHYAYYNSQNEVNDFIQSNIHSIQCVVAQEKLLENAVPFGAAQRPSLTDYADGIDTMCFLNGLIK